MLWLLDPEPATSSGRLRQASSTSGAANSALSRKLGSLTPGEKADITLIRITDVNTPPAVDAHHPDDTLRPW